MITYKEKNRWVDVCRSLVMLFIVFLSIRLDENIQLFHRPVVR